MRNGNVVIVNKELEKVKKDLSINVLFLSFTLVVFGKTVVELTISFSWYLAVITPILGFCLWKFYQIHKILKARKLKIIDKCKGISIT